MDLDEEESEDDVTAGASFKLHSNFKVFARAVLALNRIGNELYMEPNEFGLALRSLNCSRSAFGTFLFSKTFFSECDVSRLDVDACGVCRIPMKCALSAFKCVKSSEKAVLSCQLYLNPRADTMRIKLTHTYDVVRYYEIPFFECSTTFRNVVDKAKLNNCFVVQAKLLLDLFNRMHHSTDEILIDAKMEEISFRNYITHEQDRDTVMKTEGKIPVAEFQRYAIKRPVEITVNLKELKAIVSFADNHQSPVSIYFDQPGTPMVVALENDVNYTAEVILATAVDETSTFDVNPEVPVQIIHVPAHEKRETKRKKSHSPSDLHVSGNSTPDYISKTKSRIAVSPIVETNGAKEPFNEAENMALAAGIPQASSSPIRNVNSGKRAEHNALPEHRSVEDDAMDFENDKPGTSKVDGNIVLFDESSGSESPPSRGPALFRYLFALDEPTCDSEDFLFDAKVLVSDSEPEASQSSPERYDFDSDFD